MTEIQAEYCCLPLSESTRISQEQPTRLRILWGENPLPSIARFGRLAYPEHGEVTIHGVLG